MPVTFSQKITEAIHDKDRVDVATAASLTIYVGDQCQNHFWEIFTSGYDLAVEAVNTRSEISPDGDVLYANAFGRYYFFILGACESTEVVFLTEQDVIDYIGQLPCAT